MGIVTELGMGIDCMEMGGNKNVKSHSRTCLVCSSVNHISYIEITTKSDVKHPSVALAPCNRYLYWLPTIYKAIENTSVHELVDHGILQPSTYLHLRNILTK